MEARFKPSLSNPEAFIANYYRTLDTNELQPELTKIFHSHSKLQFNGEEFRGTRNIVTKLVPGDFDTIVHELNTQDYQPLTHEEYLVSVLGTVTVDGGPEIKFSTNFVLDTFGTHQDYYIKYLIVRSNIFNAAT